MSSESLTTPWSHIKVPPFTIKMSPSAGRVVVATEDICRGTVLLRTRPPIMSVIMREYRKEVCAFCYLYNAGRNLPVRLAEIGKAFCSKQCLARWREESFPGLDASIVHASWTAVESFIQKSAKRMRPNDTAMPDSPTLRPDADDVEAAFTQIRPLARAIKGDREADVGKAPRVKSNAKARRNAESGKEVDPDILTQLLPGILLRADRSSQKSWAAFQQLAHTPTPYASALTLSLHCEALLQLLAILPYGLLQYVNESTIRDTIAFEAHNSFGIRSLDDKGDEFLGYGVWPEASFFNHSCSPNVAKIRGGDATGTVPNDGRVWTYWTSEDVKAGDELSITYLGGEEQTLDLAERRQRLSSTWGFDCMCRKCKAESK